MDELDDILLFDRYLGDEMDATEKQAFEERLVHSESLKQKLADYVAFSEEIKAGVDYINVRKNLANIHTTLYERKTIRFLRPAVLVPLGIAAGLALLVLFNPFNNAQNDNKMAGNYEPLYNQSEEQYATETEDMGYISQENEMFDSTVVGETEMFGLKDSLPWLNRTPRGTAFLISETGFLLTSKHLVEGQKNAHLQQKELGFGFEARVIYSDSLLDFAVLQTSTRLAENFEAVPYQWYKTKPELGEEVFALGYPKKDIVYARGVVSSETGYESDSVYFEISLPSNAGHSGSPLFSEEGYLIGIVTAHQSDKQLVTYALKHSYIEQGLSTISESILIDQTGNYHERYLNLPARIRLYRPFIFEVH